MPCLRPHGLTAVLRRSSPVRALLATGLLLSVCALPAHADDNYFTETHYDLGIQSVRDLSFGGTSASGTAVHLTEHNGLVSRVPYMLILFLGAVQGGGDVKMVGSYSETPRDHELQIVGRNGQLLETKRIVTTERNLNVGFIPLTEAEKAKRDAGVAALGGQMAMLAMQPAHFDLMYLPNRDDAHLRGFRAVLYPLAIGIGQHTEIALGYAEAHLDADVKDPGSETQRTVRHRSRGVAARFGLAMARWLVLVAELHANLLDRSSSDRIAAGSTVRGTAALSIPRVERLFCKLAAERIGLTGDGSWSTSLEGGMRF